MAKKARKSRFTEVEVAPTPREIPASAREFVSGAREGGGKPKAAAKPKDKPDPIKKLTLRLPQSLLDDIETLVENSPEYRSKNHWAELLFTKEVREQL